MKHILTALFAFLPMMSMAQTNDSTQVTTVPHLDFEGISISGNIDDFTERMKPRYELKKRIGGDHYFIYEGSVYGKNTYLQANYTRKSRTVYKIVVTPKNVNEFDWTDSLTAHYGEPIDTDRGRMWKQPGGMILFYTPEGYDAALIYLDYAGQAAFKEEK